MRSLERRARAAALATGLALLGTLAPSAGPHAAKAPAPRLDARAADTVLARGGRQPKELEKWAAGAELADLVWMLRRGPQELGGSEPILARAALAKTRPERAALRARLAAIAGPDPKAKRDRDVPVAVNPPMRPRASAFRIAAFLPDSGDYADYSVSLSVGLEAGMRHVPLGGARSFDYEFWGTADDHPARVAAALEAASWRNGLMVGELLSVNTLALATGTRLLGTPLVSPTATDENVGMVGPAVFQIGPSGWSRGVRLARAAIDRAGQKVGVLVTGDPAKSAFALGFAAAAESIGAVVDYRAGYAPNTAFREEARQIAARQLEVLLWDGEAREAEVLLRELARQKVSVKICGSESLQPERIHAEARVLLEGVRYVAEEWKLSTAEQAELDSALWARKTGPATPLHVRGWLAGRSLAEAVAGGALCPEEVTAALTARCGPPPWLSTHRFLDFEGRGATLPVYVVERGKAVRQLQ